MYALLPQDLDVRVASPLPPPCCSVHPVVLEAFRQHYKGVLGVVGLLCADGVCVRACRLERYFDTLCGEALARAWGELFETMASDNEKLMLLDWCLIWRPVRSHVLDLHCWWTMHVYHRVAQQHA